MITDTNILMGTNDANSTNKSKLALVLFVSLVFHSYIGIFYAEKEIAWSTLPPRPSHP